MSVLVIAEAGVNHNGDIKLAYELIDAAKASGADIIKFQTFNPESIVSRFAQKAEYQKRNLLRMAFRCPENRNCGTSS